MFYNIRSFVFCETRCCNRQNAALRELKEQSKRILSYSFTTFITTRPDSCKNLKNSHRTQIFLLSFHFKSRLLQAQQTLIRVTLTQLPAELQGVLYNRIIDGKKHSKNNEPWNCLRPPSNAF